MEPTFALFASQVDIPDKGSLLKDLTALMSSAARHLDRPLGRAALQFALAMRYAPAINSELHSLWAQRFDAFLSVFQRATDRGGWPGSDPTLLLEALVGAVYLRVFLLRKPVTPRYLRALAEAVLAGRIGAVARG